MEIKTLNQTRGILSIYNGDKYIIFSQFYGVVAESTKILRNEEGDKVEINFDICNWVGYWDLKTIITKGIKKLENQYIKKDVTINYKKVKTKRENGLDKYLEIKTKSYKYN